MAGINEELTAEEWKKRFAKEKQKVSELTKMNKKLEEELRRWRNGETVTSEEQEQLGLEQPIILRTSVNSTIYRDSLGSEYSKSTSERDSQTEFHDDINGEMLTNGADYKVHAMHVDQLNYKIARLEEELKDLRSGSDVPIEDQYPTKIDNVINEDEIHPSSTQTNPSKDERARRGILNKNPKENQKAQKKSVTISQPNDNKSPIQPQNEDGGRIRILTESNNAQEEIINQLNDTISELENELEMMRAGIDLPENDRIYLGHEATEASYVHDTLREVLVQGLTILKDWAVSVVSGLVGAVNKLATCIASATHSQPHSQGYGTLAN